MLERDLIASLTQPPGTEVTRKKLSSPQQSARAAYWSRQFFYSHDQQGHPASELPSGLRSCRNAWTPVSPYTLSSLGRGEIFVSAGPDFFLHGVS